MTQSDAKTSPSKPKTPEPCAIVIFGAFGDLTKRLVMPAIYNLGCEKSLPEKIAVIGVDLAEGDAASWKKHLHDMMESFVGNTSSEFDVDHIEEDTWTKLADTMDYVRGDMTKPDLYKDIGRALDKAGFGEGNAIFYFAIADRFFAPVAQQLGEAGLTKQGKDKYWRRVVVEKPFGHDVDSAVALNKSLLQTLEEDQIFRIDHFLGKETVQSIMTFRFANGMFEPIWNRDRIDSVQITAAEVVGVEARGKFYEVTGALRDMIPNHLFTLMAMVAMEPPVSFDAKGIRDRKAELFASMPPLKPEDAVRGQYTEGSVKGKEAQAYRTEPNVSPQSTIETYVAMRVGIDSWRWAGGAVLPAHRQAHAGSHDRDRDPLQVGADGAVPGHRHPGHLGQLAGHPYPAAGRASRFKFEVKRPGPEVEVATVRMDFAYKDFFAHEPNVGYETLLYDVMIGDATLFNRADMVEDAWRVVQPILDTWGAGGEPAMYASGAAGPKESDDLLSREGRHWRPVEAVVKE